MNRFLEYYLPLNYGNNREGYGYGLYGNEWTYLSFQGADMYCSNYVATTNKWPDKYVTCSEEHLWQGYPVGLIIRYFV